MGSIKVTAEYQRKVRQFTIDHRNAYVQYDITAYLVTLIMLKNTCQIDGHTFTVLTCIVSFYSLSRLISGLSLSFGRPQ